MPVAKFKFVFNRDNPIVNSPLTVSSNDQGNSPPPSAEFLITENNNNLTTESGNTYITE